MRPSQRVITTLTTAMIAPGCADVALWGNIFSMLLAVAIFVGTLSLSRQGHPRP